MLTIEDIKTELHHRIKNADNFDMEDDAVVLESILVWIEEHEDEGGDV